MIPVATVVIYPSPSTHTNKPVLLPAGSDLLLRIWPNLSQKSCLLSNCFLASWHHDSISIPLPTVACGKAEARRWQLLQQCMQRTDTANEQFIDCLKPYQCAHWEPLNYEILMSHNNKAAALKHKIQPRGNRIQCGLNKKCIVFFMCVIYRENTNK